MSHFCQSPFCPKFVTPHGSRGPATPGENRPRAKKYPRGGFWLEDLRVFSLLPRTKPALQGVLVEELTTATVSEEFRGLGFGVFGFGGFSTHSRTYLGWGV